MTISHAIHPTKNITKPTAKLNPLIGLTLADIGAGAVVMDKHLNAQPTDHAKPGQEKTEPNMSLLKFARSYKLFDISIMDFIMIYILLYVLNHNCPNHHYKQILVGAIPLTILFNMVINPGLNISVPVVFVLVISIFYVLMSVIV